jgi:hypothetical protein
MAIPTNRSDFGDYCLRRLGAPMLNINVTPDQVDDRIDDALKKFRDYHYDGSAVTYLKHAVTAQDQINRWIPTSDCIQGITRIFPLSGINDASNLFDIRYQIILNDLYTLTSQSMVPYFMTMQNLQFLEILLQGEKPFRFNRYQQQLFIEMDWDEIDVGTWIIVEAMATVDADLYSGVWSDPWLSEYCTQLIKRQWGENVKKFGGMQLPGGMVYNGDKIWQEAENKIDYMLPLEFIIG